jgi:hypothetical protein
MPWIAAILQLIIILYIVLLSLDIDVHVVHGLKNRDPFSGPLHFHNKEKKNLFVDKNNERYI